MPSANDNNLSEKKYRHIITINPDKRSGQACVRNLRITVSDVLGYLASGMSNTEIIADFPDLTEDDIFACLEFAADRESHISHIAAA